MTVLRAYQRDFSGTELTGINVIRFKFWGFDRFAYFDSGQFGPGLIENDVQIDGGLWYDINTVRVSVLPGDSFSVAEWTFVRSAATFVTLTWDQRVGEVIGSSVEDYIYLNASAALVDGGGASDFIYFVHPFQAESGDRLSGGADYDVVHINAHVDLRNATVSDIEMLRFYQSREQPPPVVLFRGDAFGPGGIELIKGGLGDDTIVVEATGRSLDLSGLNFIDWGAGHDRIVLRGNGKGNALTGTTAEDWLNGRTGADTLVGGGGQDHMVVGKDSATDIIRVASPTDSSGAARDTVAGLHLDGEDRFELSVVPGAFASPVVGTLNEESFDADLAAALDEAALPAGQAVLFDPDAGTADYADTVYLIVDANGVAGYQPGADYVFQLDGAAGTLDPGDFI